MIDPAAAREGQVGPLGARAHPSVEAAADRLGGVVADRAAADRLGGAVVDRVAADRPGQPGE